MGWGDGSVSKMFAEQAWEPELRSHHPYEKLGAVAHIGNARIGVRAREADGVITGTCWPVVLAKPVSSRFSGRPCLY